MTDIVARLRSLNDGNRWPMMDEAADRIERLEEALRGMLDEEPGCVQFAVRALEPKP